MSKSVYLINPVSDHPSYWGTEVFAGWGFNPAVSTADLSITTLAGMFPKDFDVSLCDENLTAVDFDISVDYVGITGKTSQRNRMISIAKEFRQRGKVVLFGGPYASLSPESLRPHCDILVRGEVEELFDDLCDDLRQSCWKPEYIGGKPDLSKGALPDWGKYPNDRAFSGALQTSRGCPFECEFCDVIQYVGRKQRHKTIPQVLRELDNLYRYGHRFVFLADDNFTAYRSRAKELLLALRDWNSARENDRVSFVTQVSIDAARDDELLQMCAEAGLTGVFIGIETPNEDSLKETKKRQNMGCDLTERVQRFLDHGIYVSAGMIVGFDSDGLDIFKRQYEFAMATPIPIFNLGALVAPESTPLYDRMKKNDRLTMSNHEMWGSPWATNFIPSKMTNEQLLEGMRWLSNNLYCPAAFTERISSFVSSFNGKHLPNSNGRPANFSLVNSALRSDGMNLIDKYSQLGPQEAKLVSALSTLGKKNSVTRPYIARFLQQYIQIRYMFEKGSFWDLQLVDNPPPDLYSPKNSLPILLQR
jgi:radical SAM superfamily enzyme YgiQ (UPF0313 family)